MEPILQDLALLLAQEALKNGWACAAMGMGEMCRRFKNKWQKTCKRHVVCIIFAARAKRKRVFCATRGAFAKYCAPVSGFRLLHFTLIYHHHDIYNKAEVPGALVVHRELFYTLLPGCKKLDLRGQYVKQC